MTTTFHDDTPDFLVGSLQAARTKAGDMVVGLEHDGRSELGASLLVGAGLHVSDALTKGRHVLTGVWQPVVGGVLLCFRTCRYTEERDPRTGKPVRGTWKRIAVWDQRPDAWSAIQAAVYLPIANAVYGIAWKRGGYMHGKAMCEAALYASRNRPVAVVLTGEDRVYRRPGEDEDTTYGVRIARNADITQAVTDEVVAHLLGDMPDLPEAAKAWRTEWASDPVPEPKYKPIGQPSEAEEAAIAAANEADGPAPWDDPDHQPEEE